MVAFAAVTVSVVELPAMTETGEAVIAIVGSVELPIGCVPPHPVNTDEINRVEMRTKREWQRMKQLLAQVKNLSFEHAVTGNALQFRCTRKDQAGKHFACYRSRSRCRWPNRGAAKVYSSVCMENSTNPVLNQ